MKARIASLPTRALLGIATAAVLVYALALWFLLVAPKRTEATTLAGDVVAAELRLAEAQVAATRPSPVSGTGVGDVLRLVKAMPASADQSGLVLELELLTRATGVRLVSIAPGEPASAAGAPTSIPVAVAAEGSFGEISRFLRRLRGLVRVRAGELDPRGRLFAVQALDLRQSKAKGFPLLDATITLNAFVYDGPIAPVDARARTNEADDASSATAARSTP